ncbi:MAG: Uma2 family endonuclease, partial [Halobacteriota archaeon]|nr:Uma2 family endonuclease [Halobacteriota archaeon]
QNQTQPPLVPDGFLSIGLPSERLETERLSYVLWEEDEVVPLLTIEIVSKTYNEEYEDKKDKYAFLGVLYYLIYNPNYWQRDKHNPFELYRLEEGKYVLQQGEPYWMAEIGLGIGRGRIKYRGRSKERLLWYDQEGKTHPWPQEIIAEAEQRYQRERRLRLEQQQIAQQQQQIAQQERQRAERAEKALQRSVTQLFSLGITLEQIAGVCSLSVEEVEEILQQSQQQE